ncbi:MAG: hypothetical protein FWF80_05325, partial [Defluviitaleaceae bacterium]|nr:hypothetical protein [Defluviitaleaceae bacterium]
EPEVVELEPIPRPVGVVWSLSTDMYIQSLEVGARNDTVYEASPVVYSAGSPRLVIEEGPNGNAISISERNANHYTIDIRTPAIDWDFANHTYMMVVRGVVGGEATVIIGGADNPWDWLAHGDFEGGSPDYYGNNFIVAHMIESQECLDAAGSRQYFRIQTNCTIDFVINDIVIAKHTSSAFPRADNVVYSLSTDPLVQLQDIGFFETQGYGMILATPYLTSAGSPRYEIVEGPFGNAMQVRNRMAGHYAVDIVAPVIPWNFDENTYTLTVRGSIENPPSTFIIGGADNPWDWLSTQQVGDDGSFEVTFFINSQGDIDAAGSRRQIRLNSDNTEHFTLYDIVIERN